MSQGTASNGHSQGTIVINTVNMTLSIREEGRALEGMGVAWTIAVSSVAVSVVEILWKVGSLHGR